MADETNSRPVLSTDEAGAMLSVSPETIKRYIARGALDGFKLPGGYFRIYRDSVEKLMNTPVATD